MASNGRLSADELSSIPGGELRKDAAAAWNAPGGPADNGLRPTGSMSSYRTYDEQLYFWNLYQSGRGNLAAYPGTSNHGWGIAIDLAEPWMRSWMDEHGAEYGWRKTEAFSEWWHLSYVGGVSFPTFDPLEQGDRGKRVLKFSRRLAYIRRSKADRRRELGDRERYMLKPRRKYDIGMKRAVRLFQRDHGLNDDGVIGPKTARAITATFRRQWAERGAA